jgi:hypothetical protein
MLAGLCPRPDRWSALILRHSLTIRKNTAYQYFYALSAQRRLGSPGTDSNWSQTSVICPPYDGMKELECGDLGFEG